MMSNNSVTDKKLLAIAREIAMDILPLETVLSSNEISADQFEVIKARPAFQRYLSEQVQAWNSALNTADRVKLKAAASVEFMLEELHHQIHDRAQPLIAKVKAAELVSKLAGMGQSGAQAVGGTGFSVTINLGKSSEPIVIDATPVGNALEHEDDDE